jgi:hypothetical protein
MRASRSRRSRRILLSGIAGAVIGAVVFVVAGLVISTKALSIVNGLVLGVVVGFVIGILPAAERDDQDKQDGMDLLRAGRTGTADVTLEGQEARDLESQRR